MNLLLLSNIGIGHLSEDMDALLLHNYLQAFITTATPLHSICLYSAGVKLACEDSKALAQLQILEQQGTTIYACTTCINYLGLQNKLLVGQLTTMPHILEMQLQANKIFTL